MPNGNPIGNPGSSDDIREVQGSVNDALETFDELTQGGTVNTNTNFPGLLINRPDGGTVRIRTQMSRSPSSNATIDVNIPGIPIRKIKFN